MAEVAAFIPQTDTQQQPPSPNIEEEESGLIWSIENHHQSDPPISLLISDYSSSCDDESMDGGNLVTNNESIPDDNPDEVLGYEYHNDSIEGVSIEFVPDQATSKVVHNLGMEIYHDDIYKDLEVESDDEAMEGVDASQSTSMSRNLSEPSDNAADLYIENYPEAEQVSFRVRSRFQCDSEAQLSTGRGNLYYPFANEMDHELGLWLHEG
ncbi:hypothetical protein FRC16_000621, partial [Serendipita sp. 398]